MRRFKWQIDSGGKGKLRCSMRIKTVPVTAARRGSTKPLKLQPLHVTLSSDFVSLQKSLFSKISMNQCCDIVWWLCEFPIYLYDDDDYEKREGERHLVLTVIDSTCFEKIINSDLKLQKSTQTMFLYFSTVKHHSVPGMHVPQWASPAVVCASTLYDGYVVADMMQLPTAGHTSKSCRACVLLTWRVWRRTTHTNTTFDTGSSCDNGHANSRTIGLYVSFKWSCTMHRWRWLM